MRKTFMITGYCVTDVRPGEMQTPVSEVDGPVAKDFLGLAVIRGSEVKGALRNYLYAKYDDTGKMVDVLFGSEEAAGIFSLGDLYPIMLPLTAIEYKTILVSSPMLVSWAALVAERAGFKNLADALGKIALNATFLDPEEILVPSKENLEEIHCGYEFTFSAVKDNLSPLMKLIEFSGLSKLLADLYGNSWTCAIVRDDVFKVLLPRMLKVEPGIALKGFDDNELGIYNKTVKHGPWFDEYIPKLSVLVGSIELPERIKLSIERNDVKATIAQLMSKGFVSSVRIEGSEITIEHFEKVLQNLLDNLSVHVGADESES
ncbi:MAG: RAMP superfamily CRISPR-associated protein, partial [Candidatus Baldrarchaeia archaeon]